MLNECGECTACCTLFEIPEIKKPAAEPCVFLSSKGCSVHGTRPDTCRKYFCVWRDPLAQSLHLPEWACPAQTGLVLNAMGTDLNQHRIIAFETREGAANEYWGDRLLKLLAGKHFLVAVQWKNKIVRIASPGKG